MESNRLLEERIAEWRAHMLRRHAVQSVDVEELEDHLRSQVETLAEAGLDDDEAFLVAVKRLGDLDSIAREFAHEYSERLWKQLVLSPTEEGSSALTDREVRVAIGLALAAAVAIKIPEVFGVHLGLKAPGDDWHFYCRNLSFFVLPFLALFFAWKRKLGRADVCVLAVPFVAGALAVNLLPLIGRSLLGPFGASEYAEHTEMLAALHLPLALWLTIGAAYAGRRWRDHEQRMNFVRFSGEWFIYYTLIALGGTVLMMITMFIFDAIGLNALRLVHSWIMPCGGVGAVIIAAWVVEAKQSIIENMAPVLTRLFTPLFAGLLLLFLATMLCTGRGISVGREVLIGFDLLLVLVLGLLLYSISARDPRTPPGPFDKLQFLLIICALLVDVLALWAISARISQFGFSPNKTAALGENLVLLINLGWSAVLYARFLAGRGQFSALERWQTVYLPVYALWAWGVVVVFPIVFRLV